MASLQPIRGTHDLFFDDIRRHRHVEDVSFEVATRYGYSEIATPIIEFLPVFQRTLGEATDVVTKEMYAFEDRGGEAIVLRPENTASVARAFLSNGLQQHAPLKLFYRGPMFRYERPQKGRQRQFHQIGAEVIGIAEPAADVEVIALGQHILEALGVADGVTLNLNTLGDTESRQTYRAALVDYFSTYESDLSSDSRERLVKNPLRILDSKDPKDREIVSGAPNSAQFFTPAATAFFETVTGGLDALGIAYTLNPHLVRGLDYYCHTAFEFITDALGAQGTVLGGGRYDGLIEQLGGNPTPGIGWAAGIERLAMLLAETPAAPRPVAVVPIGDDVTAQALALTGRLRHAGFCVEMAPSGNMKKRMKHANKVGARAALMLGDDEAARGVVQLKDMETGEQSEVALSALEDSLARYR